jgi:hypothetical protein
MTWEAGKTTGVEYIHALAVTEPGRLIEDELSFLSSGDRLPEDKRLRIDTDPYLAFNTIDEEIVRDAGNDPPATDFTHFFIGKRVDYPRYLCSKCHSPEKLPDPYAMECPEIVIEEISYEEKPQYPYPPLYDVRHVGEQAKEAEGSSDESVDTDTNENNADDARYHLAISYSTYNPYAPYFGPTLLFYDPFYYDPFYWDPFWWEFGWGGTWGYGWSPGWCCRPYDNWAYHHRYSWWGWDDDWYGWGRDHRRGDDYRIRPGFADRTLAKRYLDYSSTNTDLNRRRSIAGSRLIETRNRDIARKLEPSDLRRRAVERNLVNETIPRSESGAVRTRELDRRIIYGGDRAVGTTGRAVDRRTNTIEPRRARETSAGQTPRLRRSVDTRRDATGRDEPVRQRGGDSGRAVDRRNEPQRRSGDSGKREPTRDRPSGSSTRGRSSDSSARDGSRSPDRRSSSYSDASPARTYSAPARYESRGSSAPPASTRSGNTGSTGRTRSR